MKAYAIIHELRTATAGVSAVEANRLLRAARNKQSALPIHEQAMAVDQVLDFLDQGKPSPATIHNRLDHLVPILGRLDSSDLVAQFAMISPPVFEDLPGTRNSAPLYKTLRSLWKFLAPGDAIPEVLHFYGKTYTTPKHLLCRDDYGQLLRVFHQHANSEDQIIWFYLASSLRLRTTELSNLSLKDIWLADDCLTVFVIGKGEKRRQVSASIPTWMSKRIQEFMSARLEVTKGDYHPLLFNMKNVSGGKMRSILNQASVSISLHDLRRYQANLARANGEPLLEGIGKLGHSTSQTALKSYVTVLPLLQAEYLQTHYMKQWSKNLSPGFSANSVARAMGVSRQAVHQYKSQLGLKTGRLSLDDAIRVVAFRIRNAIDRNKFFQ